MKLIGNAETTNATVVYGRIQREKLPSTFREPARVRECAPGAFIVDEFRISTFPRLRTEFVGREKLFSLPGSA